MGCNAAGALKRLAALRGMTVKEYQAKADSGEAWCNGCNAWHNRLAFGSDRSRTDGLSRICRQARGDRRRARYVKKERTAAGRRYEPARDGDKLQARGRVNHLVNVGFLPDPDDLPCVDCGHMHEAGGRRHHYDHHLGYDAEHHEHVEAVCTVCHRRRTDERKELVQHRGDRGRYVTAGGGVNRGC